jgi:hypothetical protein
VNFRYPNEIGPGVYDIHSPRVPKTEDMVRLLRKASKVLPPEHLWVNPDCGLKTRAWPEVEQALRNMVEAAKILRKAPAWSSRGTSKDGSGSRARARRGRAGILMYPGLLYRRVCVV